MKRTQNVNRCAVVNEDLDWGCVSEYGWDISVACFNETVPANVVDLSNMDSCRQVMWLCCKMHAYLYNVPAFCVGSSDSYTFPTLVAERFQLNNFMIM